MNGRRGCRRAALAPVPRRAESARNPLPLAPALVLALTGALTLWAGGLAVAQEASHDAQATTAQHPTGGAFGNTPAPAQVPQSTPAEAGHAADAHGEGGPAAAEHGAAEEHGEGGDVFTHLFHHMVDEVVVPLPAVRVGPVLVDLSITKLVVMIWVVVALNIAIFGALAVKCRSPLPRGKFHNLFEALVVFVKKDMVEEIMGHHLGPKFTPYFLTLFFFILFANLLGLVPFMHTATGNIAVTASLAILTLFMMQFAGIREQGLIPYVKNIVPGGIPFWLYPIMVPVEILGQFTKPFALTIRLFANMTAGHVVILSLFGLLFLFKSIVLAPAVIGFVLFVSALELLVCFLQAYIFTFLSILFVNACAHPEH